MFIGYLPSFIIILGIISLSINVWLFIKYSNANLKLDILDQQKRELVEQILQLQQEKIELIRQTEQVSTKLNNQSSAQAEALSNSKAALYDLSHNITKQLLELHKQETQEAKNLSEQSINRSTEAFNQELQKVQELVTRLNKDMSESKATVDNIRQALLSPSATGYLAEITLENILKNSGLKVSTDFILQYSFAGDQSKLRPDALVFLPNDNLLIIDAKSSQYLLNNENEDTSLLKSMQAHLKSLSAKDYNKELTENFARKNLKFNRVITLMFMPTEQAIERLIKLDDNFLNKAWQQNIYPVGPIGLMNMLSLSRLHIAEQLRLENYEQILLEINGLINSINILAEHGMKLGTNIVSLVNNYDKFAGSFNRNLLTKARSVQQLGVNQQAKLEQSLERYQLVSGKNELFEAEFKSPQVVALNSIVSKN